MGIDYTQQIKKSQDKASSLKRSIATQSKEFALQENFLAYEELGRLVSSLAYAEGELSAYLRLEKLQGLSRENFTIEVAYLSAQLPQDTWSGRSNDLRRSFNDGFRESLNGVIQDLKYGSN